MNRSKSIFIFQILWIILSTLQTTFAQIPSRQKPNIIYILTDQWRASATGYSGDPNVKTPNIDALAKGSLNFKNAVSITPVCTPHRAALMTGRYPTTTGMFLMMYIFLMKKFVLQRFLVKLDIIPVILENGI